MEKIMENNKRYKYYCSECGAEISIDDKICPKCGADVSEINEDESKNDIEQKTSKNRYSALKTISGCYTILGWLVAIGAVYAIFYGISKNNIPFIIVSIILGLVVIITLFATSEWIKLFIDLEKNTRDQNKLLFNLLKSFRFSYPKGERDEDKKNNQKEN